MGIFWEAMSRDVLEIFRISMPDYKSISACRIAFMTCATLVNTHIQTDRQTDTPYLTRYTISSAICSGVTIRGTDHPG